MSFDWSTYLDLAEDLGKDSDESKKRSAISRAYYSVLITARNKIALRIGVKPRRRGTHQWVRDQFDSQGSDGQRIAKHLQRLCNRRNQADYDNFVKNLDKETMMALVLAKKIKGELTSFFR